MQTQWLLPKNDSIGPYRRQLRLALNDAIERGDKARVAANHLGVEDLNDGEVDIYVCGPPPIVEGVRRWTAGLGVTPKSFHFEKFSATHEAAK